MLVNNASRRSTHRTGTGGPCSRNRLLNRIFHGHFAVSWLNLICNARDRRAAFDRKCRQHGVRQDADVRLSPRRYMHARKHRGVIDAGCPDYYVAERHPFRLTSDP
jgi:hypothetical protein